MGISALKLIMSILIMGIVFYLLSGDILQTVAVTIIFAVVMTIFFFIEKNKNNKKK